MKRLTLLPLVFAFAGCHDFSAQDTLPTGPKPRDQAASGAFRQPSQLWAGLTASERKAAIATIERIYAEQGDLYVRGEVAVSEGGLPGGRATMVLQDPDRPERPLLLLSGNTADEQTAVDAIVAFSRDRTRTSLGADGGGLAGHSWTVAGSPIVPHPNFELGPSSLALPNVTAGATLVGRASSARRVDIPGVGRATLVKFE